MTATYDVALISPASTGGWRLADRLLAAALAEAGATVCLKQLDAPPPPVRTFALTDLVWALRARRLAQAAPPARALIYCSLTAALLWQRPGAIRFDTLAGENRPGRHGLWQRPLERRRLAEAPLLIPMAGPLLDRGSGAPQVVVPVPVERSGPPAQRDIAALTYAANPHKKGLPRVLEAFGRARKEGEELVVAGVAAKGLARLGIDLPPWARATGPLPPAAYRALLRRARVFLCAPQREDYGLAQLEALADGCLLVTAEAAGPYPALALARQLDPRLVGEPLERAVRTALDDPRPDYDARAAELLAPYSPAAVRRQVAGELLPALLRAARRREQTNPLP